MIKSETATTALLNWCDERGISRGVEEFMTFLKRRNLTYVLPSLLAELDFQVAATQRQQLLKLATGRELRSEDKTRLQETFSSADAEVSIQIKPDLIAGVSVEQNGDLAEASVNQQLQSLKNYLHT